jgi:hypothetical protein
LTEIWDLGDHQIRPALKRGEKVPKWGKVSLRMILTGLDLRVLGIIR